MKFMKFRNSFEIQNIYFSFLSFSLRNIVLLKNNKILSNNSNKFLFLKIQIKKKSLRLDL